MSDPHMVLQKSPVFSGWLVSVRRYADIKRELTSEEELFLAEYFRVKTDAKSAASFLLRYLRGLTP